jgi:hypothetical protein
VPGKPRFPAKHRDGVFQHLPDIPSRVIRNLRPRGAVRGQQNAPDAVGLQGERLPAKLVLDVFPAQAITKLGAPTTMWDHDTRAIQGWLGHRSSTRTAAYTRWRRTVQGLLAGVSVGLPASPRHARDVSSPDDGQRDQGSEDHQHHGGEITHH